MTLTLTMSFSDNPRNPRVLPLKDGTVKPEGIELKAVTIPSQVLFYQTLTQGLQFDVSEMSISETLLARERNETLGGGKWEWTPIPVFLSRGQFWADLHVNTSSGIKHLRDLKGKRIGVPDYVMTGALWFKVTLKDLYGIDAWEDTWYNCRTREASHGGALGFHLEGHGVANGVTLHWLTVDQTGDVMLARGELDALIPVNMTEAITAGDPTVIDRYGGTPWTGNPSIRRLLHDQGKAVITEFFRKTGVYQANHHVVVKNSVLRDHPWVAMELYRAFQRSKEVAYERAKDIQSTYLYFEKNAWKEQAEVFGEDPYPLGLRAMRKTVERAIQGSLEQGLITKPVTIEDLYFPATLDT